MPRNPATPIQCILVVDDEEQLAKILARRLTQAGFKAITCGKLSVALRQVQNQKFDCIVLDMRLEQGSGERVIQEVRGDKKGFNFDTPIMVMSGHLDVELVMRIGRDVHGVQVKPFDFDLMVEKVRSLCLTGKLPAGG